MNNLNTHIPHYKDINSFLESISNTHHTQNSNFYCLKLEAQDPNVIAVKAPYRKDFYFLSLITQADISEITYDTILLNKLDSFLAFQMPGQVYSFNRSPKANGYIIYFQKELFDFFKPDFEQNFPFFDVMKVNFFSITTEKFITFSKSFIDVFEAYFKCSDYKYELASYRFLALLQELKQYTQTQIQLEQSFQSSQEILYRQYIQLVNKFYLEKRTVEEYAQIMNVSANYLSKTISKLSDKSALQIINERVLSEAKMLLCYTDFDVAEIAFQLNYSDTANFGKFFKKLTNYSPMQFKRQFLAEKK